MNEFLTFDIVSEMAEIEQRCFFLLPLQSLALATAAVAAEGGLK